MKTKKPQVLMILVITMACVSCAVVSFAEQAARYAAEQEGKHIFLVQTKEDMGALRSCLQPHYRPQAAAELTAATPCISTLMPSARAINSTFQPDQTAIAASPRPEITAGPEEKK